MGDLLSAISVLLVFLTFLFQSIDKEISEKINTSIPDINKRKEREKFKEVLRKLFIRKAIPISVVYIMAFYSLLPKTISIIRIGKLDLWNFNPLATIFIFIECGTMGLTIYAIIKTVQLIKKFYSFTP